MTFTNEMIEKARKAASAEELLELAKAESVELSAEEAEQYYSFLNGSRELTEEDLQMVAGGKGGPKPPPNPRFRIGQTVDHDFPTVRSTLKGTITGIGWYSESSGWWYNVHYYQMTQYFWEGPKTTSISEDQWENAETSKYIKVY